MTLAAMALYADGPTRLTGIASWRVKETDRIAAMGTELRKLGAAVVEGADFIEIAPPRRWRAATLAHLRRPPHGDVPVAGRVQPARRAAPPCPVRILDPRCVAKTFPDYFETLFGLAHHRCRRRPGDHDRRPHRLGQGHAGRGGRRPAGLPPARFRRAVPRHRAGGAMGRRGAGRRGRRWRGWPAVLDLRFGHGPRAAAPGCAGVEVSAELRLESAGQLASRVSALPAVRAALHRPAAGVPPRARPGRRRARHGHRRSSPTAPLKVFLTASAAERAERRYKQLISKGISANIDSLRADLEARDARDRSRSVSPLRPAEDALLARQLAADASKIRWLGCWLGGHSAARSILPSPRRPPEAGEPVHRALRRGRQALPGALVSPTPTAASRCTHRPALLPTSPGTGNPCLQPPP